MSYAFAAYTHTRQPSPMSPCACGKRPSPSAPFYDTSKGVMHPTQHLLGLNSRLGNRALGRLIQTNRVQAPVGVLADQPEPETPSPTGLSATSQPAPDTDDAGSVSKSDYLWKDNIDVRAQFAFGRMLNAGDGRKRWAAAYLVARLKQGHILGIYGDDLYKAARLASTLGTVRWRLHEHEQARPRSAEAVLIEAPDVAQTPVIIFRERAGNAPALDNALVSLADSLEGGGGGGAPPSQPPPCMDLPLDAGVQIPLTEMGPLKPYAPLFVHGSRSLAVMNEVMKQSNRPPLSRSPLGMTVPLAPGTFNLPEHPVTVKALPVAGEDCFSCVADWPFETPWSLALIAYDYVVEDKAMTIVLPGAFHACGFNVGAHVLEVRKKILPAALSKVLLGEYEHYLDHQVALLYTGYRLFANTRKLAPGRSHLRGRSLKECERKVADFLNAAATGVPFTGSGEPPATLLSGYNGLFLPTFLNHVAQSTQRDKNGHGIFVQNPPPPKHPIKPTPDKTRNPFGCEAFARYLLDIKDIPGKASTDIVKDLNDPLKRSWHVI